MENLVNVLQQKTKKGLKKMPILLNYAGLLEVERLFPEMNINQLLIDMVQVDPDTEEKSLKKMPNATEMLKFLYAGHFGYCTKYSQKPKSYDEFTECIELDILNIIRAFYAMIGVKENEKKDLKENS